MFRSSSRTPGSKYNCITTSREKSVCSSTLVAVIIFETWHSGEIMVLSDGNDVLRNCRVSRTFLFIYSVWTCSKFAAAAAGSANSGFPEIETKLQLISYNISKMIHRRYDLIIPFIPDLPISKRIRNTALKAYVCSVLKLDTIRWTTPTLSRFKADSTSYRGCWSQVLKS